MPESRCPFHSSEPIMRHGEDTYARIYEVVRRIPEGRVATYGQVAALADLPGHARQVGYALHALPEGGNVPWHRVINARGAISLRSDPGWGGRSGTDVRKRAPDERLHRDGHRRRLAATARRSPSRRAPGSRS